MKVEFMQVCMQNSTFYFLPIIIMGKTFKMPPPVYSFEEMLEIADAMERLWNTLDRIEREEKKKVLYPNKTIWEAKSNCLKINIDSSKKWNQKDY